MIRRMFVIALLTVFPSMSSAQTKAAVFTYAGAASADLASTYAVLASGSGTEGNPIAGWLSDRPKTLVLYSAALDATAVYVAHRTLGARHPKLMSMALYTIAAGRVGLVVWNLKTLR